MAQGDHGPPYEKRRRVTERTFCETFYPGAAYEPQITESLEDFAGMGYFRNFCGLSCVNIAKTAYTVHVLSLLYVYVLIFTLCGQGERGYKKGMQKTH